jgi:predicted acylesterase/phospholipase RssA
MFNPLKFVRRNRTVGLALGRGGAKGLAHIGVLEYLEEAGISVDMIAGSSIGAVVGALHCAGTLKRFRDDLLELSWKDRLAMVDPVVPKKGLLGGKKLLAFLSRYIPRDANIEDIPVRLAVVTTDYGTWGPLVFEKGKASSPSSPVRSISWNTSTPFSSSNTTSRPSSSGRNCRTSGPWIFPRSKEPWRKAAPPAGGRPSP